MLHHSSSMLPSSILLALCPSALCSTLPAPCSPQPLLHASSHLRIFASSHLLYHPVFCISVYLLYLYVVMRTPSALMHAIHLPRNHSPHIVCGLPIKSITPAPNRQLILMFMFKLTFQLELKLQFRPRLTQPHRPKKETQLASLRCGQETGRSCSPDSPDGWETGSCDPASHKRHVRKQELHHVTCFFM